VSAAPPEQIVSARVWNSNRISSLILFGAVALAPLLFGSAAPIAVAGWCVVLGTALALASPSALRTVQLLPLAMVGVLTAAFVVVLHEQLSDRPWSAIASHPIWQDAERLLRTPLEPSVSITRNEPFFALGKPFIVILAFTTSYIVCVDRRRAQRLLKVVAVSGVIYALVGIAQFLFDPTRLLWHDKIAYVASLTGPFVNRNTAAAYFGSCAIICLLFVVKGFEPDHRGHRVGLRDFWSISGRGYDRRTRGLLYALFGAIVLVSAMLMTGSRAGVAASLLGMVAALTLIKAPDLKRRQSLWILLAAGATALLVLQFLGGTLSNRFNQSGLVDVARADAYRSTWRMASDFPWFGTGFGTFGWSFPAYRGDSAIWGTWQMAHDTILEIASEAGLPFAVLTAVLWGVLMATLLHGVRVRRRDRIIPVSAFSIALVGVAHSLVDFSLQIPGYSIVAFAMFGAGVAQSYRSQVKQRDLP